MNPSLPRALAAVASVALTLAVVQGVASLGAPNERTTIMVALLRHQPMPAVAAEVAAVEPTSRGAAPSVVAMRTTGVGD